MQSNYTTCKISLNGTNFVVRYDPNRGLGENRIIASLKKAWPKFHDRFQLALPDSTIVDSTAAPLGGGPIEDFVIGVYSSDEISAEQGAYIEQVTGWAPEKSTADYIEKYYAEFEDPYQAYSDDMVTHELGHLIFGFGLTKVQAFNYNDAWFSLGLGLLFDRLIWDEIHQQPSPLFGAGVTVWKTKFKNLKGLDQYLVNPDLSKDEQLGLNRIQTYGHSKAWSFLGALRESIGEGLFDRMVVSYLSRPQGAKITYDDFLSYFPAHLASVVDKTEDEYLVR